MAKASEKQPPKRLIPLAWQQPFGDDSLEELLLLMAINVEDALWTAGAVPGQDYDHLRLFELAQPLVLDYIRTHKKWQEKDFLRNVRLLAHDDD